MVLASPGFYLVSLAVGPRMPPEVLPQASAPRAVNWWLRVRALRGETTTHGLIWSRQGLL